MRAYPHTHTHTHTHSHTDKHNHKRTHTQYSFKEENGDCEIVLHTAHNWGGRFFHKNKTHK